MEKDGFKDGRGHSEMGRWETSHGEGKRRSVDDLPHDEPNTTLILPTTRKHRAQSSTARRPTTGMPFQPPAAASRSHPQVTATTPRALARFELPVTPLRKRDEVPSETLVLPETRVARRASTARPIRACDTALVERATVLLRVVEAVPANPRELTSAATGETAPVTVIPRTVELPAVWSASVAPRARRRGIRSTLLIWGLACAAVLAVVSAATPLTMRLFAQPFVPSAARMALNPGAAPSGPWASISGAVETLGVGGGAGPGVTAPGTAGLPVQRAAKLIATQPPTQAPSSSGSSGSPSGGVSPAPVSPWPPSDPYMFVPGHYSFAVQPNGFYPWAFGQCTWWAQWERRDENLTRMGNAMYWASGAAARGYRVGGTPAVGATVVFQPGVEGAGGAGHVAHVVAVYPGGWFLVSEMNFYWNGGGWGRVDYRFAHTGWGVQFIY